MSVCLLTQAPQGPFGVDFSGQLWRDLGTAAQQTSERSGGRNTPADQFLEASAVIPVVSIQTRTTENDKTKRQKNAPPPRIFPSCIVAYLCLGRIGIEPRLESERSVGQPPELLVVEAREIRWDCQAQLAQRLEGNVQQILSLCMSTLSVTRARALEARRPVENTACTEPGLHVPKEEEILPTVWDLPKRLGAHPWQRSDA